MPDQRRSSNRGETCTYRMPAGHPREGELCGKVHARCLSHKGPGPGGPQSPQPGWGDPCGMNPLRGLEVCKAHGGASRNARAAAAVRAAKADALGEVGHLLTECGVTIAGRTHVEALDDALTRAGQMVMALGILVEGLDIPGDNDDDRVLWGPDHQGDNRPHILVDLYGQWLDRHGRLIKIAADLGIEERRVAIDEARAQAVVGAVLRGIQDAGVDTPQVRAAVADRLRTLEAHTVG